MDHGEPGGESIGALLSSLATTLREVSDKLDAVAGRVDENRDDNDVIERLAKLEAWAFRAGDDMTKLDARLEHVESGGAPSKDTVEATPSRLDASRPDSPKLPSRAQRREATVIPPLGDQSGRTPTAPFEITPAAPRRDPAPAVTPNTRTEPAAPAFRNERLESPTPPVQHEHVEPATITPRTPRAESTAAPFHSEPFGPATHSEPRNSRLEQTAPTFGSERLEPPAPPRSEWPETAPTTHSERPEPAEPRSNERLTPPAQASRNDWADFSSPAAGNGRGASTAPTNHGRTDYSTTGSSNGRTDYSSTGPSNGRLETPPTRPDSGMTAPRNDREEAVPIPPGAHRAATTTEDNSHVDKLQAMLDELKRNGPFGARPEAPSPGELPGIDPHFAVRTEG
ncbi:hypothetical protein [Nocardia sp. NPDC057440]|uniref:hypothetical protein n=1 Tax=Nocardia sp. NPDC057440 TaxID=3346134 RepID=UPI00366E143A